MKSNEKYEIERLIRDLKESILKVDLAIGAIMQTPEYLAFQKIQGLKDKLCNMCKYTSELLEKDQEDKSDVNNMLFSLINNDESELLPFPSDKKRS